MWRRWTQSPMLSFMSSSIWEPGLIETNKILHYLVGIDLSIGKPYVPFEQLAPALLVNYLWSYSLRYGPEDQDDIAHSDSKPRILLLGLRRSACSIIHTNYNFYNSTCTVYNLVSCYSDDCIELQVIKLLTCPIIKYM